MPFSSASSKLFFEDAMISVTRATDDMFGSRVFLGVYLVILPEVRAPAQSTVVALVIGRRDHGAMGYKVLKCVSLAAVASIALSVAATAGMIEGAVTFPSQLVPSMTVYVRELDTSRVHSA